MSADLLRRAAVKLREHAQAVADADTFADGTPWTVEDDPEDAQAPYVVAEFSDYSTAYIAEGFLSRAHADFAALLHPPAALALAELLEHIADDATDHGAYTLADGIVRAEHGMPRFDWTAAVALARAVLREEAS